MDRGRRHVVLALALALALALCITAQAQEQGFREQVAAHDRAVAAAAERASAAVVALEGKRPGDDPDLVKGKKAFYVRPVGPTSAVVIDAAGYILTSRYNTLGPAGTTFEAVFADGARFPAKLLGYDEQADLACLKIDDAALDRFPDRKMPVLEWAGGLPDVGRTVVGVGRSPDPTSYTVNVGIVSAHGRQKDTCLQTDVELNYGNSGGAIVDLDGRLVGVACHINNRSPWGQSSGVGFAAKAAYIATVLDRLKAGEKIVPPPVPWLGIEAAQGEVGLTGVRIAQVAPESPAAAADLQEGDVIVEFDGKPVKALDELQAAIRARKVGDTVKLKVQRAEQTLEKSVTLEKKP